jgi:hypothetical protein
MPLPIKPPTPAVTFELPLEVSCEAMRFTVAGRCMTPLDHRQQALFLAALKPLRLDWPHPQLDGRGQSAWLYIASLAGEDAQVAVVVNTDGHLLKLRAFRPAYDRLPAKTMAFAIFLPPAMAYDPPGQFALTGPGLA